MRCGIFLQRITYGSEHMHNGVLVGEWINEWEATSCTVKVQHCIQAVNLQFQLSTVATPVSDIEYGLFNATS